MKNVSFSPTKIDLLDKFDGAWKEAEEKVQTDDKLFDDIYKSLGDPQTQKDIEKELEDEYKKLMESFKENPEDMYADLWQNTQDREEAELYGDIREYAFSENNPYAQEKNPLEKCLQLSNKGRTKEAILALESHLVKHPKDIHSWRFLGRLHQENDQDRRAVSCLMVK